MTVIFEIKENALWSMPFDYKEKLCLFLLLSKANFDLSKRKYIRARLIIAYTSLPSKTTIRTLNSLARRGYLEKLKGRGNYYSLTWKLKNRLDIFSKAHHNRIIQNN